MRRLNFFLLTVIIISAASCSSDEIGNSKDVSPDTIYQQYSITYNESESSADIFVQFRFGGSKGTTLVLNEPSSIQFDGTMIKVDSGGYKGAWTVRVWYRNNR
ncbi:MAG: hypothetical protein ABJA78_20440, partial [Ferruginibacter sp.]